MSRRFRRASEVAPGRTYERPWVVCPHCGLKVATKQGLFQHLAWKHGPLRGFRVSPSRGPRGA